MIKSTITLIFLFFTLVHLNAQVNWTASNNGLPSSFAINSFSIQNSTIYALGSYYNGSSFIGKLYKSTDSGANWAEVSTTGLSTVIYGKAITSLNGSLYVAGGISSSSQQYSVFKSQDNGQTWTISNNGLPLSFAINSFSIQNSTIYALGSYYNGFSFIGKLYKSTDSGANWTEVSTTGLSTVIYGKAITSLNGSLYVAGGISSSSQQYSVFKSQDNGQTWTISNNGLPSSFAINSFSIQNSTIYALGSYYNGSSFIGKLYKSTDSGANWTEVSTTGLSSLYYGNAILYNYNIFLVAGGISNSSQVYSVFSSTAETLSAMDFFEKEIDINYFPNPVKNSFTLKSNFLIKSVSMFTVNGMKIYEREFQQEQINIEMNNLPQGYYMVNVVLENSIKTFKIIKN